MSVRDSLVTALPFPSGAHPERRGDQLPGDPDSLWSWCLIQPQDRLLDLLAVCAAHTLDAVQAKDTAPDAAHLHHADSLAEAMKLDMAAWFTPTATNFFGRISRAGILDALAEVLGKPPARSLSKLKKPALAAHAERAVAGIGSLPRPRLPIAVISPTDDEQPAADAPLAEAA